MSLIKTLTSKLFTGRFTFRNTEIARLDLQQQADAEGGVLLDEPYSDNLPSGYVIWRQQCLIEREVDDDN